ncbi:unnamed protein product [Rhizoctonia solani]|uniref:Rho termination factor-like N-terminal domain-containing protein n=1 Tax=Rhizoctonia solani TaxID=456999 RepID=A0A8H3E5H0_9AGAM|nr:unnamed protein product [Rhizoctonia solani]
MNHASLSKLNVAKLKEKCKELKITGYSKLSKPLLIEKLLGVASSAGTEDSAASEPRSNAPAPGIAGIPTNAISNNSSNGLEHTKTIVESNQPQTGGLTTEPTGTGRKRTGKNKVDKEPAKKRKKIDKTTVVGASDLQVSDNGGPHRDDPAPSDGTHNQASTLGDTLWARSVVAQSPTTSNARQVDRPADPAPLAPLPSTQSNLKAVIRAKPTVSPPKPKAPSHSKPLQSSIASASHPSLTQPTPQVQPTPVPPRKLQTYKPKTYKPPAIIRPPRTHPNSSKHAPEPVPCLEQSLDFPSPELCTSFPLISMPPSTARRRQAERMGVVFSGIKDGQVLGICARVSRAWRHAGTPFVISRDQS